MLMALRRVMSSWVVLSVCDFMVWWCAARRVHGGVGRVYSVAFVKVVVCVCRAVRLFVIFWREVSRMGTGVLVAGKVERGAVNVFVDAVLVLLSWSCCWT